jgi:glycosyltransferase involved in cell wall biosynthesis
LVREDPSYEVERRRLLRYKPRFQQAAAVIAVSQFSADQGIEHLGLHPSRVHVIHHGVDAAFQPPRGRARADRPYAAFVGEFGAHRGHAEAFEVVGALADAGYPHRLQVAGRIAPHVRPALQALRASAPRPDRIELLGFVDSLVELYQRADVALVTSRHEGFCLPAVEAMACGTPVVAFANTAITEVVGDGGVLVDDGDVESFVKAVRAILDDPARWDEMSAAALARARRFDWRRSVAAHVEIYRAVSGG